MSLTAIIEFPSQVLGALALTTTEDYVEFTLPANASSLYTTSVQLRCTGDWWYSHQAGGPYYPVYAREVLTVDQVFNGKAVFCKAASGTPALYALEASGRAPAIKS
jgi:hypothetical protein